MLERVLDARIRRSVEVDFGEEQQGFWKRRGTADGMVMETLRWMGASEAEVRMVEGKYKETTARVLVEQEFRRSLMSR